MQTTFTREYVFTATCINLHLICLNEYNHTCIIQKRQTQDHHITSQCDLTIIPLWSVDHVAEARSIDDGQAQFDSMILDLHKTFLNANSLRRSHICQYSTTATHVHCPVHGQPRQINHTSRHNQLQQDKQYPSRQNGPCTLITISRHMQHFSHTSKVWLVYLLYPNCHIWHSGC